MKTRTKIGIGLLLLSFAVALWASANSDWHKNRNRHNQLPAGTLTKASDRWYQDENGRMWELQPHIKNAFHQPDQAQEAPERAYPNMIDPPVYDPDNPNLKLLCLEASGGSYEAILQPDGNYLTTGAKRGTYNYAHPSGLIGMIKHVFLDVLPHLVNPSYED